MSRETGLSPDGRLWWDGVGWRSVFSPDGRWRWSGREWVSAAASPSVPLAPFDPFRQPPPPVHPAMLAGPGLARSGPDVPFRNSMAPALPLPPSSTATSEVQVQVGWALRPTEWTVPLEITTVLFFAISGLIGIGVATTQYGQAFVARLANQLAGADIPSADANSLAQAIAGAAQTYGVVTGIAFLALAAASFTRRPWVFVVGTILAGLGTLGLLSDLVSLGVGGSGLLPIGISALLTVRSVISGALFVWMVAAAIRFGPWACRRVPLLAPASAVKASYVAR